MVVNRGRVIDRVNTRLGLTSGFLPCHFSDVTVRDKKREGEPDGNVPGLPGQVGKGRDVKDVWSPSKVSKKSKKPRPWGSQIPQPGDSFR